MLGTWVYTFSLPPGTVRTELLRYTGEGLFFLVPIVVKLGYPLYSVISKTSWEGAQTTIHCAVSDEVLKYNGYYFRFFPVFFSSFWSIVIIVFIRFFLFVSSDCKPSKPFKFARSQDNAVKLWDISAKMVSL